MNPAKTSMQDLNYQYYVAESVVEQFALSHTPTAILRELVQNEYDAGGQELGVHFSSERLVITGNGDPIDAAGWERLRVMLGTGWVPNSDTYIEPKKSSIGSKNFGLRSLFTVGDEIEVYSAGKWSALNWRRGAIYPPRETNDSPERGVRIEVPYRPTKVRALEPFTPTRRSAWAREISDSLAETLIKLAHPGRSQSLRQVILRTDDMPEVSWTQRAREDRTSARGIRVIRREALQESAGHRNRVVELEYQAQVQVPESHREKDYPSYYRINRNRMWIGVSLRLFRGRPDATSPGLVYYPLGAPLAKTGNLVSLNAPFEMDNNRANIVSPSSSSWNEWLVQELVDLTTSLLITDWYERFGAGAYLALEAGERDSGNHLAEAYADAVLDHLRSKEVWASRGRTRKKVIFVAADTLVLPDKPEYDGFFDPDDYLDGNLATNGPIIKLSSVCGAKRFGPDSLIRLKCAGEDASRLLTKPQDQGNWYFMDFDRVIRQLPTQIKFAQALDRTRLSDNHKKDLSNSPTTLAADDSLRPLLELYLVPPDAREACPLPPSQRLHPDLAEFRSLRRLATKYDMTTWIKSTARRSEEGLATAEQRRALMKFILARRGNFDAGTLSLLRRSPVLLDHRGHWVEPRKIMIRQARGARALAEVLSFPARSYAEDSELRRRLSFRTKLDGEDLVDLAERVSTHPDLANSFETALLRHHNLVKPGQWRRLKEIECLRSSDGTLKSPQELYVRTRDTLELLGDTVAYAEGLSRALQVKMGCNVLPRSSDIVAAIHQNRRSDNPTADTLYVALLEAIRRERRSIITFSDEDIVWTPLGYVSPSKALVSSSHAELFAGSVPVARPRSEKAVNALRALGCRTRPTPEDWVRLITSISQSVGTDGVVSNADRLRLRRAYAELRNGIPDGAGFGGLNFVLCRDGRLRNPNHAYIDDYPQLAILLGDRVPIADDIGQGALRFYDSCGVKRLSDAAILSRTQIGSSQEEPNRIGVTKLKRQLDSRVFRSALSVLINREVSERPGVDAAPLRVSHLPRIESLVFVDSILHKYQLGDVCATIQARHLWQGETLYVVSPQTRTTFRDTVSYALAETLTGSTGNARMCVSAIYRLLDCNSSEEIAEFLVHRGIPWQMNLTFEDWGLEREADWSEDQHSDGESIAEQFGDSLTASLVRRAGNAATNPIRTPGKPLTTDPKSVRRELPPIEEVLAQELTTVGTQITARGVGGVSRGGGGGWSPRDPEWDSLLGERGEEIAYLLELERVREAGHEPPESVVTWVSRDDPTADHDIRSIAKDGAPLWIEVKSTSGSDGNFDWPESEVAKAMAEREHYVLCRVYRVDSNSPLMKRFHDPLSMIESGQIRLGLGSVRAQVESAETSQ